MYFIETIGHDVFGNGYSTRNIEEKNGYGASRDCDGKRFGYGGYGKGRGDFR